MKLKIGISPCPNDTYIFEAIYNKEVQHDSIEFQFVFEDVETLNQMATRQELDVVKISYAHYFSLIDDYVLLRSGGAMGFGTGPLLIAKSPLLPAELVQKSVAIPGIHTTANFLLSYALPHLQKKIAYGFENIENAVLNDEVTAGVIIHETRFTYRQKGLHQIMDLGQFWEHQTGLPIPLGGIAVKRSLPDNLISELNLLVRKSVEIANTKVGPPGEFIKMHAQEMHTEVMKKHIDLYVNSFTVDVGTEGRKAAETMKVVLQNKSQKNIFI